MTPPRKTMHGTVVCDPPWHFSDKATRGAAEDHYPTMRPEELRKLSFKNVVADNAHMYLWTTGSHLELAVELMKIWGFKLKQEVLWVKTNDICTKIEYAGKNSESASIYSVRHVFRDLVTKDLREDGDAAKVQIGLGHYYRNATETCLLGVRGSCVGRVHNLPNVIFAPRGKHSSKPEMLQTFAEMLSPGPYLEVFGRRERKGWTVIGNEVATSLSYLAA